MGRRDVHVFFFPRRISLRLADKVAYRMYSLQIWRKNVNLGFYNSRDLAVRNTSADSLIVL
jgi:hypothetical protein